jgi:hypothetical protein
VSVALYLNGRFLSEVGSTAGKLQKCNDVIGRATTHVPDCSIVPQPIMLQRAPLISGIRNHGAENNKCGYQTVRDSSQRYGRVYDRGLPCVDGFCRRFSECFGELSKNVTPIAPPGYSGYSYSLATYAIEYSIYLLTHVYRHPSEPSPFVPHLLSP